MGKLLFWLIWHCLAPFRSSWLCQMLFTSWCATIGPHSESAPSHFDKFAQLNATQSLNSYSKTSNALTVYTFSHYKAYPHIPRHPSLWDRVTQLMSALNTFDIGSPLKNTLLNLLRGVVVYWLFPHLEIHDRSQYILRGGLGFGPRLKSKGLQYNYTPQCSSKFWTKVQMKRIVWLWPLCDFQSCKLSTHKAGVWQVL